MEGIIQNPATNARLATRSARSARLDLPFKELQNSTNGVWGNLINDPRILDVMLRRAAVPPNARGPVSFIGVRPGKV